MEITSVGDPAEVEAKAGALGPITPLLDGEAEADGEAEPDGDPAGAADCPAESPQPIRTEPASPSRAS
ncbi:MAG TPA: hypothetical protein VF557_13720 [Jatrophihabitans sp.]|uniref:hypothetical protein n=1 Tax=Jatrophihabitans sp. TaxID=1932789 RepID=UPI002EDEE638